MSDPKAWEIPPYKVPSYEEATQGSAVSIQPTIVQQQPLPAQPPAFVNYPMGVPASFPPPTIVNNVGVNIAGTCGACQSPLHTEVRYHSTCSTHCGFILCCIFCCIPCAPFVYCSDTCRQPRVYCANCNAPAGFFH